MSLAPRYRLRRPNQFVGGVLIAAGLLILAVVFGRPLVAEWRVALLLREDRHTLDSEFLRLRPSQARITAVSSYRAVQVRPEQLSPGARIAGLDLGKSVDRLGSRSDLARLGAFSLAQGDPTSAIGRLETDLVSGNDDIL